MTILALDTSSKAASCAVLRGGRLVGEFFLNTALIHSRTIMPMVKALLDNAELPIREVDLFAVSTGPGSFTGLRIGIAAVKGLAMGTGRPCAAVSTLEGLAENLSAFTGAVVPVMDARRGQFYSAIFDVRGGTVTRVSEDAAISIEQLRQTLGSVDRPVMLAGDGAELCKQSLSDLRHLSLAPENLRHQRAASVAAVAARIPQADLVAASALAPVYLRRPQAERERLERLDQG